MAQPAIQTSFNAGELSPSLFARVDLAQYHRGAATLRNFFVDYRGGASTRAGTEYLAPTLGLVGTKVRLIPFQASSTIGYVLEFGNHYIRFYFQGAQVLLAGNPYTISTPYDWGDLPLLKFVQNVSSLIICHPNYPPAVLTILAANNWTLSTINFGPTQVAPGAIGGASNLAAGTWTYGYLVTAVDIDGHESVPSPPVVLATLADIVSTNGTNTVSWGTVSGAASYNVYKTFPVFNTAIVAGAPYGFIGNTTGLSFTDTTPGITPDFSQTPPIPQNPVVGGSVISLLLTLDAAYTVVPSIVLGAAPAGGYQATAYASLGALSAAVANPATNVIVGGDGVTGPNGQTLTFSNGVVATITTSVQIAGNAWRVTGISLANRGSVVGAGTATPTNPVAATSASGGWTFPTHVPPTVNIIWSLANGSLVLIQGGFGYTAAPGVTFAPAGATATTTISPTASSGGFGNPSVPGFLDQRLVLAAPRTAVQSMNLSKPGEFFNFDISNPSEADDAIQITIVGTQLNQIKSLVQVPTGLITFTSRAAWLVNGGGGQTPVTPANIQANSQAFEGANDLPPIQVNYDILYGQAKGPYIRDLTFNFYVNIFTGTDISAISSHLFYGYQILEWAWAEEPFKTVWAVRSDGVLLSLAFLKEQELVAWAHSDTLGLFSSVCTIVEETELGLLDATYFVTVRTINGTQVQMVERMAERFFRYGVEDAWCVDCALQSQPTIVGAGTLIVPQSAVGASVTLTSSAPDFAGVGVGWIVRSGGGIIRVTGLISNTQVQGVVTQAIQWVIPDDPLATPNETFTGDSWGGWTIWQPFTVFTGLTHLIGMQVSGLADGVPVGPLDVSGGGTVTLPFLSTKVVLGLPFTAQLKTLAIDLGEPTVQGKRKKITAVTARCENTLGLTIGSSFSNLVPMKDLVVGNVGSASNAVVTGLVSADARTIVDPAWTVPGQYCFQQSSPLPATILGVIPEITVGDTK